MNSEKSKYKVLVAHYMEDLSWLTGLDNVVVYSKTNKNFNFINHNKGNEVPHYLSYIIDNYDNLPEKTLFLHGHWNSYHQEFPSADIINKINWDAADYFSINRRDYYQEDLEQEFFNWVIENWNVFEKYIPKPEKLIYYSCAQFVVAKHLILQNPKEFYIHIRNWIETTNISDYISSRVLEYTWHYIFTRKEIEPKRNYSDIFKNEL
jgi:Protein of unknown function (DUF3431)